MTQKTSSALIFPNGAKLLLCILLGTGLWWMDSSVEIDPKAWHIFSVFIAVILSFILRPYPLGMSVLLGLLVLVGTETISLQESLSGFSDTTVWLVIAAFMIADAVLKTGFGNRIALFLVSKLGKSMKGIAYAICGSEFLLASVIPSNTARGGGIHAPIVDSLAHSIEEASTKPILAGRYLSLVGSHANLIAASMYLTGMAANPLVSKAAKEIFDIDFGWGSWLMGSIVPGMCSLLLLPLLIYRFAPPAIDESQQAQESAARQLKEKGKMQRDEKIMMYVLIGLLLLWGSQILHGLSTTLIAWIGVAILLLSNTQSWEDVIRNEKAWDTLFWLGGLLTMAGMLAKYGFIQWFVDQSQAVVSAYSGIYILILLALIYFYSMYAFSMLSGHIAAMVGPFLGVCLAAGAEPMLAIPLFAYFSCLCGCMTNYSSGPVIIYYGLGYETSQRWFRIGFLISIVHIGVWLGIGMLWWKVLGWW
ncbi:MAG: DASS family sodium-coupled anion symporter [Bacteroidota bacterium]